MIRERFLKLYHLLWAKKVFLLTNRDKEYKKQRNTIGIIAFRAGFEAGEKFTKENKDK